MAIPQEYIAELIARNDVVEIISRNVQLKRRGRTYLGLCPFHNEKTPSFIVYPETQSFYCFGCGAGGDIVTFTKNINNLDYVESIKLLAGLVNMPMPNDNDNSGKIRSKVLAINKETARFFHKQLNSDAGKEARAYWRGRRLSDAIITKYGLGYAPDSFFELSNYLKSLGFTKEELIASAVVKESDKGNLYDVFRNRVMVPIFDLRGNVIAFGGRNLGDEKPKYINSAETIVYKKSKTLYALNMAKKINSKRYILCEGYMDVLAMHQAGFTTAIAGCGTALTQEQVKLISEYADEVVLCYDSDEAGQKAAKKAIEIFSYSPVRVSVLKLDGAKDPDEFIAKFGKDQFERVLNGANNAVEYELFNIKSKYDITTADGRVEYIKNAITVLAGKISPTQRDVYVGRLAQETDVDKKSIFLQLEYKIKQDNRFKQKQREKDLLRENVAGGININSFQGGQRTLGIVYAEQQLVTAILKNTQYYQLVKGKLSPTDFINPEMANVFGLISKKIEQGQNIDLAYLSQDLPENTIMLLGKIIAQNYDTGFQEQDVILNLEKIQKSVPVSASSADKSPQEIMDSLKKRGIIK